MQNDDGLSESEEFDEELGICVLLENAVDSDGMDEDEYASAVDLGEDDLVDNDAG